MRLFYLTILILFFHSCRQQPDELSRMLIPGSSKVIYQFRFNGPAWGVDHSGMSIIDSTLEPNRKTLQALPVNFFEGSLSGNGLQAIRIHYLVDTIAKSDTSILPLREFDIYYSGIPIHIREFKLTYGAAPVLRTHEYTFDNYLETEDSLMLYGLRHEFGAIQLPDTMAFPKGNISLEVMKESQRPFISISTFFAGRSGVYFPGDPLRLVDNQPVVGVTTFHFFARNTWPEKKLSEYGIYHTIQ